MLDTESFLLGIAAGGGGDGGNPNDSVTIKGTLANPFGKIEAFVLAKEIADGNATATLTFEAKNKTWVLRVCYEQLYPPIDDEAVIPFFYVEYPISIRFMSRQVAYARVSYNVHTNDDIGFDNAPVVRLQSATEEADIDPTTSCTLTIIYHPMP